MAKEKAEKSLDELLKEALVKEGEEPYEVPGNWEFVRLGEVVQINPPKIRPEISDDKLCSFVPMKAVSDRLGIIENIEMKPFGKVKGGYTSFKENDVLFAKITPCMENGKVAIAKNLIDGFGYGTTEFFVLRCSNIVLNKFLYYIVRSQAFRDSAKPNMTGTVGQRRVPKAFLHKYKLPFPPLPEQKRIVKKLSSMLGKLKEAKELIQEARDTFEERRAATLNKAFTGELTKKWRAENPDVENTFIEANELKGKPYLIPATWKWIEFCDLTKETKIGLVRSVKEQSNSFKCAYLKMNNITIDGTLDINDITKVNASKDEVQAYSLKDGDLLFNTRNSFELVGKNTVFKFLHKENVLFNNNIMRIRFLPDVYPKLISHFLNSTIGKLLLNGIKKCTTNVAAIYAKNLNTIPIPLPPKEEQKEIVRILEKLLDREDKAKAFIDMEEQIDLIEKSILSKAFRGELGTNDPDDEPAIELLKRSMKEING
ncbi:MAG: restriction endonuclease subunit S [Pseudomonadota bacterium]